ncbi:MAG: hypothetical protein E6J38_04255 [Chloroflexi bacterium]|nr:MAG: hypothetical protein E6J38_04255 [Chloroflexota bacterium]
MRIFRCPRCRAEDISADAHPARVLDNGVTLRVRVQHMARFIKEQAGLGDPGMKRLVWWNVPAQMLEDDVRWLDENRAALERAL